MHCRGCHSSHAWDLNSPTGIELTKEHLQTLWNDYVTCVLFLGGEWDSDYLKELLVHANSFGKKTALYTGRCIDSIRRLGLMPYLNYLKTGKYIEALGPLNSKSTNQRLYSICGGEIKEDLTHVFWREYP